MRTTTSGSADKSSKQFSALLRAKTSNTASLRDRSTLHDALGLDFTDRRQRRDQVVRAHLGYALLVRGQREELFERKFAGLDEALHVGATSTIGDRQT